MLGVAGDVQTSALTGPSTMSQISLVTSMMSRPDFRISDGAIDAVHHAQIVQLADGGTSVSTKNFMRVILVCGFAAGLTHSGPRVKCSRARRDPSKWAGRSGPGRLRSGAGPCHYPAAMPQNALPPDPAAVRRAPVIVPAGGAA